MKLILLPLLVILFSPFLTAQPQSLDTIYIRPCLLNELRLHGMDSVPEVWLRIPEEIRRQYVLDRHWSDLEELERIGMIVGPDPMKGFVDMALRIAMEDSVRNNAHFRVRIASHYGYDPAYDIDAALSDQAYGIATKIATELRQTAALYGIPYQNKRTASLDTVIVLTTKQENGQEHRESAWNTIWETLSPVVLWSNSGKQKILLKTGADKKEKRKLKASDLLWFKETMPSLFSRNEIRVLYVELDELMANNFTRHHVEEERALMIKISDFLSCDGFLQPMVQGIVRFSYPDLISSAPEFKRHLITLFPDYDPEFDFDSSVVHSLMIATNNYIIYHRKTPQRFYGVSHEGELRMIIGLPDDIEQGDILILEGAELQKNLAKMEEKQRRWLLDAIRYETCDVQRVMVRDEPRVESAPANQPREGMNME